MYLHIECDAKISKMKRAKRYMVFEITYTFCSLLISNEEKYSESLKCIRKLVLLCMIGEKMFGNGQLEHARILEECDLHYDDLRWILWAGVAAVQCVGLLVSMFWSPVFLWCNLIRFFGTFYQFSKFNKKLIKQGAVVNYGSVLPIVRRSASWIIW